MQITVLSTVLWFHVLALVGAFGVLLAMQLALPGGTRDSTSVVRSCFTLLNALLGVGLVAGLTVYVMRMSEAKALGTELSSGYHGAVGTKILILLAAGACLGIAPGLLRKGRTGPAGALRGAALILLLLAAFLGASLTP